MASLHQVELKATNYRYYVELKSSESGLYIQISRWNKVKRTEVIVDLDYAASVIAAMAECLNRSSERQSCDKVRNHLTLPEVRNKFPRAYMPWTEQEDEFLLSNRKKPLGELSKAMGRQPGALRSRLEKLS